MIDPQERLASVLARDERLLEVLAATSDALEMLRVPTVREVMERVVTVAEAARMANISPDELVSRLEAVLGGDAPGSVAPRARAIDAARRPAALVRVLPEQLVDVDVRADLRRGVEPFHRIMSAVAGLRADQVLRLRATFDPAPLRGVLQKRGYAAFTERLADDDWRVWFYPSDKPLPDAAPGPEPVHAPPLDDPEGFVVLDVRGLEPPEPMVRTLAALASLPKGGTLAQLNVRVPAMLLPKLAARGFSYQVHEIAPDLVKVLIFESTKE